MTTLLYTHDACLAHDPGPYHPENPGRLKAVLAALSAPEFEGLKRREAPMVGDETLRLVHPQSHIDLIHEVAPDRGYAGIDGDTIMSPGSLEAAYRAAGAVVAAVDAIMTGEADNAFCAIRPPGHHAEPDRAMGFCLFSSVAVGAAHAVAEHGAKRVAVMDFDVHHGNGTQAAFWDRPDLMYVSTHQMPLYPGTGDARERGANGQNIVNVPLSPGAGGGSFREAMERRVIPAIEAFSPDLLLISAGFDAHADDPLAGLALADEDYGWATEVLTALADRVCGGKVVSALEGGYDHAALGRSTACHVRALMAAGSSRRG